MVPPEMMNGSLSGRASSYSSMRVRRMRRAGQGAGREPSSRIRAEIEESQLAVAAVERAVALQLEHARHQPVRRMEQQRVQGALGAGARRGGVLAERELKVGMECHALA